MIKKAIFLLLMNSLMVNISSAQDCTAAFNELTKAHTTDLSQWSGTQWCDEVADLIKQTGVRKSVNETEVREFGSQKSTLEALLYDYTPTGGKPIYMDIYQQGGKVKMLQMPCPANIAKVMGEPAHILLAYDDVHMLIDGKKVTAAAEECRLYPEKGIAYFRTGLSKGYVDSYIQIFKPCSMKEYFASYAPQAFVMPGEGPRLK